MTTTKAAFADAGAAAPAFPPVEIVLSDGPLWEPSDLEEFMMPVAEYQQRRASSDAPQQLEDAIALDGDAEPPADRFLALMLHSRKFYSSWNRTRDFQDQSASSYDQSLANIAALDGWDAQEITNLLIANRRKHGDDPVKSQRLDYFERTVGKALRAAEERNHTASADGATVPDPEDDQPEPEPDAASDRHTPPASSTAIAYAPGALHCTDMGNAQRLIGQHRDRLRYVPAFAKWLVWTGTHWRQDDTGEVERLGKQTVMSIYDEAQALYAEAAALARDSGGSLADSEGDPAKKRKALADEVWAWARRSEAKERLRAMIDLARTEPGVPVTPDELDSDTMLLNVQNGTLDLRTGELRNHDRADLITKIVPVAYDRDATAPVWAAFLDTIMDRRERLIAFLQRAAGYCLTGDVGERCLFICYGSGRNGKSTFVETLAALLGGDYAVRSPTDLLLAKREDSGVPNDLARLKGVRYTFTSEAGENRRLDESKVKEMTGGDTQTARFMRGEYFDFAPRFKIWLSTNHRPVIRGTDKGIWDKIRLIPFTVRIPDEQVDPQLPAKLRAELPGILAWAVEGLKVWRTQGLGMPDEIRAATDGYRNDMDTLGLFIADSCVVAQNATVRATPLYQEYQSWAKQHGEKEVSQTAFGIMLSERGFQRKRDSRGNVWAGIGLKASED